MYKKSIRQLNCIRHEIIVGMAILTIIFISALILKIHIASDLKYLTIIEENIITQYYADQADFDNMWNEMRLMLDIENANEKTMRINYFSCLHEETSVEDLSAIFHTICNDDCLIKEAKLKKLMTKDIQIYKERKQNLDCLIDAYNKFVNKHLIMKKQKNKIESVENFIQQIQLDLEEKI